jgi:preprotein translocase subunit SecG
MALAISISLFGLSLLEFAPTSWLFWIDNRIDIQRLLQSTPEEENETGFLLATRGNYRMTITTAYRLLLWMITIHCIGIIPSAIGTHVFANKADEEREAVAAEEKDDIFLQDPTGKRRQEQPPPPLTPQQQQQQKQLKQRYSQMHWSIRWIYRLTTLVCKISIRLLYAIVNVVVFIPAARLGQWITQKVHNRCLLPISTASQNGQKTFRYILRTPLILFLRDPVYRKSACLGCLVGTGLAWAVLFLVGPLVVERENTDDEQYPKIHLPILSSMVSWLCAVGILLSSLMNGFGSVSMPYYCLAGLFLQPIHSDVIANAENEVQKTRMALDDKHKEMITNTLAIPVAKPRRTKKTTSLWRRVIPSVKRNFSDVGDEVSHRKKIISKEIAFLETLLDELNADVEEMRYSQTIAFRARSPVGRIRSWIGVVFSFILFARLGTAMRSIWRQHLSGNADVRSSSGLDPVTQVLLWMLGHHFVKEEDLHAMSQFVSLLISVILSVSQMRNFLHIASTVRRRTSSFYRNWIACQPMCCKPRISLCSSSLRQPSSSPRFSENENPGHDRYFSHLVSALMCCYCLACVVLTKMMLPYEYRAGFSAALGSGDTGLFRIRTYAVDFMFSFTALLSASVLFIILGIMRSNARRYAKITRTTGLEMHTVSPKSQDV